MLQMAPDADVQIFRSKKGFEKLAYEGFLYNLDKRHQKYVLWRCEMSKKPGYKCSGRVRMTEDSLDVKFNVLLNILLFKRLGLKPFMFLSSATSHLSFVNEILLLGMR